MKDSKRSSDVLGASGAYPRRVKSCVQKDWRITADVKLKSPNSYSFDSKNLNHLAWFVALNAKPSEDKLSPTPQVNWKCPPKIVLDHVWHVASGEESTEVDAQKYRETTVIEAVYPHSSAIPPSPHISPVTGDDHCDVFQMPLVPVIPIEESVAVETSLDTSLDSQLPCPLKGQLASENLNISQCKSCVSQDPSDNEKSLLNISSDLESSDLEVAVAAAATVAAVMESKQDIDTELLIKFLRDPIMIKKLINESKIGMRTGTGTISGSKPSTPTSLLISTPDSVVDTTRPVLLKQSLPMPITEVKMVIGESKTVQGKTGAHPGLEPAPVCMPTPEKNAGPPQLNCQANPINKLAEEASKTALNPSGILKSACLNYPRPLISNDCGVPSTAGAKSPLPCSSLSKPCVDALKPRINGQRTPILAGVKTGHLLAPQLSTSTPYMEARFKMIGEYRAPNYLESDYLMHTSTSMAGALKSNLTSTCTFNTRPFSPRIESHRMEERINYCKSLVKNHGRRQETGGHNFGQPLAHLQGLVLIQDMNPNERINPGYHSARHDWPRF